MWGGAGWRLEGQGHGEPEGQWPEDSTEEGRTSQLERTPHAEGASAGVMVRCGMAALVFKNDHGRWKKSSWTGSREGRGGARWLRSGPGVR